MPESLGEFELQVELHQAIFAAGLVSQYCKIRTPRRKSLINRVRQDDIAGIAARAFNTPPYFQRGNAAIASSSFSSDPAKK